MAIRKFNEQNVRKLTRTGDSITVTLPIEYVRELKWQEKQRVVVTKHGKKLIVEDFKG